MSGLLSAKEKAARRKEYALNLKHKSGFKGKENASVNERRLTSVGVCLTNDLKDQKARKRCSSAIIDPAAKRPKMTLISRPVRKVPSADEVKALKEKLEAYREKKKEKKELEIKNKEKMAESRRISTIRSQRPSNIFKKPALMPASTNTDKDTFKKPSNPVVTSSKAVSSNSLRLGIKHTSGRPSQIFDKSKENALATRSSAQKPAPRTAAASRMAATNSYVKVQGNTSKNQGPRKSEGKSTKPSNLRRSISSQYRKGQLKNPPSVTLKRKSSVAQSVSSLKEDSLINSSGAASSVKEPVEQQISNRSVQTIPESSESVPAAAQENLAAEIKENISSAESFSLDSESSSAKVGSKPTLKIRNSISAQFRRRSRRSGFKPKRSSMSVSKPSSFEEDSNEMPKELKESTQETELFSSNDVSTVKEPPEVHDSFLPEAAHGLEKSNSLHKEDMSQAETSVKLPSPIPVEQSTIIATTSIDSSTFNASITAAAPGFKKSILKKRSSRRSGMNSNPEASVGVSQILNNTFVCEDESKSQTDLSVKTPASSRKSVAFLIPGERSKSKRKLPKTPKRNLSMSESLEVWLSSRADSISKYRHLHCLGEHLSSPNRIPEMNRKSRVLLRRKSSICQSPIAEECEKENIASNANPPQIVPSDGSPNLKPRKSSCFKNDDIIKTLEELQDLINKDYPPDAATAWLDQLRDGIPKVEEEPLYWSCRSLICEKGGNLNMALKWYTDALDKNTKKKFVKIIADKLEELIKKIASKKDLNSESESDDSAHFQTPSSSLKMKPPGAVQNHSITKLEVDLDNMFESTRIDYDLIGKPHIKRAPCVVLTPVRRSARLHSRVSTADNNTIVLYQENKALDGL